MKKALVVVLVLLIVVSVGIYAYDVAVNGTPYNKNLFKVAILVVSFVASIVRILKGGNARKPLNFYEKSYPTELAGVFVRDEKSRKKLLEAIRFYNENKFQKAISLLDGLKSKRPAKKDLSAVLLFTALCYTDWGLPEEAVKVYNELLLNDEKNTTALSNLGILYSKDNKYYEALECFEKAIDINPDNHFAYNNMAQMYYREGEYEGAVECSLAALDICPGFRQSAALLAIIYGGYGYDKEYAKYYKIAVDGGEDPDVIERLAESVRMGLDEDSILAIDEDS